MRPSLARARASVATNARLPALVMVVLSLAVATNTGMIALVGSLAAIVVTTLAILGGVLLYARSVRIAVDADQVCVTDLWGRVRAVPRREVGGVALREIPAAWGRSQPLMLIYDRGHRCIRLFDRRLWAEEDVDRLQELLCRRGYTRSRRTSFARMAAEFPGSARWWQLHGTLVGAALVLVPTLVIIIVIAILR